MTLTLNKFFKSTALAAVLIVGCMSLSACLPQNQGEASSQQKNSAYMVALHAKIGELQERLTDFDAAAARGDLASMKVQLDNASVLVSDIKDSKAPEDITSIKDAYVAGIEELESALQDFTNLYGKINSEQARKNISDTSYAADLAAIQKKYDSAIESLKAADEKASKDQSTKQDS